MNFSNMSNDALDALIQDIEAERERRKVKPCVRRMEAGHEYLSVDGIVVASVNQNECAKLNIDHATAKRQIALAFCWADWAARANQRGLARIDCGTSLHDEFCWLVTETRGEKRPQWDEHARAAGWIK